MKHDRSTSSVVCRRFVRLPLLPLAVVFDGSLIFFAWTMTGIHKLSEWGLKGAISLSDMLPSPMWYLGKPNEQVSNPHPDKTL